MAYSCRIMGCTDIEEKALLFIKSNPNCTAEEISEALKIHMVGVNRLLNGMKNSRSCKGLLKTGKVIRKPGERDGRLVWRYVCTI